MTVLAGRLEGRGLPVRRGVKEAKKEVLSIKRPLTGAIP